MYLFIKNVFASKYVKKKIVETKIAKRDIIFHVLHYS